MQVGVLKDLPVPLLLVQDWSGLDRLLWPQPSSEQPTTRRPPSKVCSCPVYLATESDREGESQNENLTVYSDLFQQVRQGGSFAKEQLEDDRLKHCWGQVRVVEGKEHLPGPHPSPHFVVQNGQMMVEAEVVCLLYCVANRRGEEKHLLVVQQTKTELVMELAHSHPMAGHLGAANTLQRLRDHFHWPCMDAEVRRFCQCCPVCQHTAPQRPPPSPLIPMAIIEVPFERIGMDLVGPLPKSARGHEHILVIVNYATRYPEAVPLRKATPANIARELVLLFSRVGIPKEILTDQGTPFASRLLNDLCRLLKIQQRVYNRPSQPREFQPGDQVLVLLPNASCKFLASWQGPYTVTERVGPVMYLLRQPGSRRAEQIYHVNLLKRWVEPSQPTVLLANDDIPVVDLGEHLSEPQRTELNSLVLQFSDVFSETPGQTNVISHDIRTPPGFVIRQRPYRVPEACRQAIEEEVQRMLKLEVLEAS